MEDLVAQEDRVVSVILVVRQVEEVAEGVVVQVAVPAVILLIHTRQIISPPAHP